METALSPRPVPVGFKSSRKQRCFWGTQKDPGQEQRWWHFGTCQCGDLGVFLGLALLPAALLSVELGFTRRQPECGSGGFCPCSAAKPLLEKMLRLDITVLTDGIARYLLA